MYQFFFPLMLVQKNIIFFFDTAVELEVRDFNTKYHET